MGMFGDFNNKKNKKVSKDEAARKVNKSVQSTSGYIFTPPEVVRSGKKKDNF